MANLTITTKHIYMNKVISFLIFVFSCGFCAAKLGSRGNIFKVNLCGKILTWDYWDHQTMPSPFNHFFQRRRRQSNLRKRGGPSPFGTDNKFTFSPFARIFFSSRNFVCILSPSSQQTGALLNLGDGTMGDIYCFYTTIFLMI